MPGCLHPEIVDGDDGPECGQCGTEVPDGAVPKTALRELVERLHEDAEEIDDEAFTEARNTFERTNRLCKADGLREAADQLEELIDDD